jgi:hypothetical protein
MVDEGLALFVERFQPEYPEQAINHILLGLGYFDDVDPDDALPVPRAEIVDYWTRRQPEIVAARGRLNMGESAGEAASAHRARTMCVIIVCTVDYGCTRTYFRDLGRQTATARIGSGMSC